MSDLWAEDSKESNEDEKMKTKRLVELLAYAKVCFDKCTNPFELMHLSKKEVTADECRDLSFYIADIIEQELDILSMGLKAALNTDNILAQAEKDFAETQT